MSRDSRALPVKPRDDYKLWSPQPDPATIKPCPICSKRAEVWQYAAKPDSQLLRVVMCTNGEAFGPQVRDGGSLFSGCMLYMPPDDFYRATTKEAVRYWNEYAEAIAAQRSESADALDAARYRWLREKVGATTGFQLEVARVKPWSLEPWSGGQLDLAVDTAIEKSRQAERDRSK